MLQDYWIVQKKDDVDLNASGRSESDSIFRTDARELLEVELLGNRMNVGEGDGKRNEGWLIVFSLSS